MMVNEVVKTLTEGTEEAESSSEDAAASFLDSITAQELANICFDEALEIIQRDDESNRLGSFCISISRQDDSKLCEQLLWASSGTSSAGDVLCKVRSATAAAVCLLPPARLLAPLSASLGSSTDVSSGAETDLLLFVSEKEEAGRLVAEQKSLGLTLKPVIQDELMDELTALGPAEPSSLHVRLVAVSGGCVDGVECGSFLRADLGGRLGPVRELHSQYILAEGHAFHRATLIHKESSAEGLRVVRGELGPDGLKVRSEAEEVKRAFLSDAAGLVLGRLLTQRPVGTPLSFLSLDDVGFCTARWTRLAESHLSGNVQLKRDVLCGSHQRSTSSLLLQPDGRLVEWDQTGSPVMIKLPEVEVDETPVAPEEKAAEAEAADDDEGSELAQLLSLISPEHKPPANEDAESNFTEEGLQHRVASLAHRLEKAWSLEKSSQSLSKTVGETTGFLLPSCACTFEVVHTALLKAVLGHLKREQEMDLTLFAALHSIQHSLLHPVPAGEAEPKIQHTAAEEEEAADGDDHFGLQRLFSEAEPEDVADSFAGLQIDQSQPWQPNGALGRAPGAPPPPASSEPLTLGEVERPELVCSQVLGGVAGGWELPNLLGSERHKEGLGHWNTSQSSLGTEEDKDSGHDSPESEEQEPGQGTAADEAGTAANSDPSEITPGAAEEEVDLFLDEDFDAGLRGLFDDDDADEEPDATVADTIDEPDELPVDQQIDFRPSLPAEEPNTVGSERHEAELGSWNFSVDLCVGQPEAGANELAVFPTTLPQPTQEPGSPLRVGPDAAEAKPPEFPAQLPALPRSGSLDSTASSASSFGLPTLFEEGAHPRVLKKASIDLDDAEELKVQDEPVLGPIVEEAEEVAVLASAPATEASPAQSTVTRNYRRRYKKSEQESGRKTLLPPGKDIATLAEPPVTAESATTASGAANQFTGTGEISGARLVSVLRSAASPRPPLSEQRQVHFHFPPSQESEGSAGAQPEESAEARLPSQGSVDTQPDKAGAASATASWNAVPEAQSQSVEQAVETAKSSEKMEETVALLQAKVQELEERLAKVDNSQRSGEEGARIVAASDTIPGAFLPPPELRGFASTPLDPPVLLLNPSHHTTLATATQEHPPDMALGKSANQVKREERECDEESPPIDEPKPEEDADLKLEDAELKRFLEKEEMKSSLGSSPFAVQAGGAPTPPSDLHYLSSLGFTIRPLGQSDSVSRGHRTFAIGQSFAACLRETCRLSPAAEALLQRYFGQEEVPRASFGSSDTGLPQRVAPPASAELSMRMPAGLREAVPPASAESLSTRREAWLGPPSEAEREAAAALLRLSRTDAGHWRCAHCGFLNDDPGYDCNLCWAVSPFDQLPTQVPTEEEGVEAAKGTVGFSADLARGTAQPAAPSSSPEEVEMNSERLTEVIAPKSSSPSLFNNPFVEVWLCRYCGHENTEQRKACHECGDERSGRGGDAETPSDPPAAELGSAQRPVGFGAVLASGEAAFEPRTSSPDVVELDTDGESSSAEDSDAGTLAKPTAEASGPILAEARAMRSDLLTSSTGLPGSPQDGPAQPPPPSLAQLHFPAPLPLPSVSAEAQKVHLPAVALASLPPRPSVALRSAFERLRTSLDGETLAYVDGHPELETLFADFVHALHVARPDNAAHFASKYFFLRLTQRLSTASSVAT